VVNNGDGTVTYTPNSNFNGADSFTYTVSDGNGGSDTGTVTVNVTPVNDPPTANDDSVTTSEDTAVTIDVLANDVDPDGDPLSISATTSASRGTLVSNGDGTITYTPNANVSGADSFTYTTSDGNGGSATATVNVTISSVNDAPVAVNDVATTTEETPVTIDVLANDSDVDGDALTVSSVSVPGNGTVVIGGINVSYTPNAGFVGTDTFTYTAADGHGGAATALVTVTVTSRNEPPVADASATVTQVVSGNNSNAVVHLDGSRSSDPDGDALTYSWYVDGGLVPVASGVLASVELEVGDHSIMLLVDDGQASGTDTIVVHVITAAEAVDEIIDELGGSDVDQRTKRPLIATLKSAAASFDRGNDVSGNNQLHAFENKVRAQLGKSDPETAAALIRAAQAILAANNGQ
jgi:hypothetical protein